MKANELREKRSKKYLELQSNSGINVGDKVKVVSKATSDQFGWDNVWASEMNQAMDKSYTVASISDGGIRFTENIAGYDFAFPFFVLNVIEERKENFEKLMSMTDALLKKLGKKMAKPEQSVSFDDFGEPTTLTSHSIPIEEALKMDIPKI